MEWLNYHHLFYFWTIAREGSVSKAGAELRLAQPTLSAQLKSLEESLQRKLFVRSGRELKLTEEGRIAFQYAEEIFGLGRELKAHLKGRPSDKGLRLIVGIADVLPKLVAYELVKGALHLPKPVQIVCREDKTESLLAELAAHKIDLVLSDTPLAGELKIKAFNHLLGECELFVYGVPEFHRKYRKGFPHSLNGAPFLFPLENTPLRRGIDQWLEEHSIYPQNKGEFEDSALLKVFAEKGLGVFVGPSVIANPIRQQYQLQKIGVVAGMTERYYAISAERRLKHPAVVAICELARRKMFG